MSKYPLTGPFTNGTSPGISASFLNNLETFLEYASDTNITTDGSGNLTMASAKLTTGTLTRIAFGFTSVVTTGTTITHNLGVVPSCILLCPTASGITFYVSSSNTTTTFQAFVSTNNNVFWIAIA